MANRKSAPPRAGKSSAPNRRAATPGIKKKSATGKSTPKKSAAAAPLLARTPKKVGKVTGADKPKVTHRPKAGPAPLPVAINPLALARPWMQLGLQMTLSAIAIQARMARAAMDLSSGAAALRYGAAIDSCRDVLGGSRPKSSEKS